VPSRMPQPHKLSASVLAAQAALIRVPALPLGALASRATGIDGADLDAEAVVEQRDEDTLSCQLPDVPLRMPQALAQSSEADSPLAAARAGLGPAASSDE
jgi:hypothetical protein